LQVAGADEDLEDEDGILFVDHTRSLPDEAFELPEDSLARPKDMSAGAFLYRHSPRRSIMLDLGIDPGVAVQAQAQQPTSHSLPRHPEPILQGGRRVVHRAVPVHHHRRGHLLSI